MKCERTSFARKKGRERMKVEDAIDELRLLPKNANVVIFNPCTGETLDLEVLTLKDGMVQLLFGERPKTGSPFAPL